ncbi:MAG: valine--tRNA ligase [Simkaniaceae bacterium]|nr:valine--tRNA ligase [Simkaniaceae bacterium]
MKSLMEKVYRPSDVEARWYDYWSEKNYFHSEPNPDKKPFTIVIPPPNVTGMLTMGHVLNNTMQDILIRKARMEGYESCWIPGTDHASIATESKVVSMLKEQGINKDSLSRDDFLKHAWEWKEKYGGIIINQLKTLGCSCDWERERFTMDEGYTRAVLEAFVRLYEKGLVYRGKRLVNWCPVSKSAISDEEVIHREVNGHLWHFRYPISGTNDFLIVATTRPETMLGDTAVAVHPDDERYTHLIGKTIDLPLVGRQIPIIADVYVDPEFGTGCVKVTPAHDPNDFAMGETHRLEFINIMNDDASMNENVPEKYRGLTREDARKAVVNDLDAGGFLAKVEDYTNKVGYSERGHVPIEHYMSEQWFLKMEKIAQPAIEAVNEGKIKFHPEHWVKTYNHWMGNIKDWCISRQLWWGHRIPVYTCDHCGHIMVQVDPPDSCAKCKHTDLTQDPDVLDTWASSWLWPFAVHSWPEKSEELSYYYPTNVLVTGPDIIFFWVARMIMAGYEFLDEYPFTDVYFTSILRDETGRKFSKSLGNSPDPFDLFEKYGTDAVRFGIMLMAPQGLDVLFSETRLGVGRNFINKLWNASRFVVMNLPEDWQADDELDFESLPLPERWVLTKMNHAIARVDRQLKRFHFNEAAKVIYDFTWNDFCDWYIEIAKTRFNGEDEKLAQTARMVAVIVLKKILALLHPYAPFVTEELWSTFKDEKDVDLMISPWPIVDESQVDDEGEKKLDLLKDIITGIRTIRSRMNVPPSRKAHIAVRCSETDATFIAQYFNIISSLAGLENFTAGPDMDKPPHAATAVVGSFEIFIPLEGLIDLTVEKSRLEKRLEELQKHILGIERKLGNPNFVERAPKAVVNREREKLGEMNHELSKVETNLGLLV